jgi:hypothetical protein
MRLQPLQEFVCDTCGDVISSPDQGWVEWLSDGDRMTHSFRIIHKFNGRCAHHERKLNHQGTGLTSFVGDGPDSLTYLYAILDEGYIVEQPNDTPMVRDIKEWAELARRVSLPHYEQARRYLPRARAEGHLDGLHEGSLYLQDTLRMVIDLYADDDSLGTA